MSEHVRMFSSFKNPSLLQIYLMHLFSLLSNSLTSSIFILYAIELKADILTINLTTTIAGAMAIFLRLPFGVLSDKYGRKPMLVYSNAVVIVGTFVRLIATDPDQLIYAAFLGGLSGGEFLPILLTMISDVTEPEERKAGLSMVYIFSGIGMLISPIVSTVLVAVLPPPAINRFKNIYCISLIGQLLLLLYIIIRVHETKPNTSPEGKVDRTGYTSILIRHRSYQGLLLTAFLFYFARSNMTTYLQVYAKETLQLSDAEVSSFTIFTNVSSLSVRLVLTTVLAKFGLKVILVSFLMCNGIINLLSLSANNFPFLSLVFFISGACYGGTRILESVWVSDNSRTENRGVANSLEQSAVSSGNIMKLATSPIVTVAGYFPVFILSGILCFIATLPTWFLYKPNAEEQPSTEKAI